jgi:hypothetical protein
MEYSSLTVSLLDSLYCHRMSGFLVIFFFKLGIFGILRGDWLELFFQTFLKFLFWGISKTFRQVILDELADYIIGLKPVNITF